MSRQVVAGPRRRRSRWLTGGIAVAAVLVVLVADHGVVAQAIAGAMDRALGQTTFDGPVPPCTTGDRLALNATLDDWDRTLLDTEYALPREYAPTDLVAVGEAGVDGRGSVRALVILDLEALGRAARSAGVELSVQSAYRSFDAQRRTFESLVEAYGREFAIASAGRPGHSEHQLGTTLDFASDHEWLAGTAWRFGFSLSYPADRSPGWTCYKPESWHYRYVGRDRAAAIHGSGLSPREWLWLHGDEGH